MQRTRNKAFRWNYWQRIHSFATKYDKNKCHLFDRESFQNSFKANRNKMTTVKYTIIQFAVMVKSKNCYNNYNYVHNLIFSHTTVWPIRLLLRLLLTVFSVRVLKPKLNLDFSNMMQRVTFHCKKSKIVNITTKIMPATILSILCSVNVHYKLYKCQYIDYQIVIFTEKGKLATT